MDPVIIVAAIAALASITSAVVSARYQRKQHAADRATKEHQQQINLLQAIIERQDEQARRLADDLAACETERRGIAPLKAQQQIAEHECRLVQRELDAARLVLTDQETKLAEATARLEERYVEVIALREQLQGLQAEVQLQSIRHGWQTDQMRARLDYYRHLAERDRDATKELPMLPEDYHGPDTT